MSHTRDENKIITHCYHCGKKFTAERSSARYCSNRCKMQWHANGSALDVQLKAAEQALERIKDHLEINPRWATNETLARISGLRTAITEADMTHERQSHEGAKAQPLYKRGDSWQCIKCGQMQYEKPSIMDKCAHCGRIHWQPSRQK